MKIVGYADRLGVTPGETVRFMVSSTLPSYQAKIVRLIHGDPNPEGPGVKETHVPTSVDGEYPGRVQRLPRGSYVRIDDHPLLDGIGSFTLAAWVWPTLPTRGAQGLLGRWSVADGRGFALAIDENGQLAVWIGAAGGQPVRIASGAPLRERDWCFVAASYDAESGQVVLVQQPLRVWPNDPSRVVVERQVGALGALTTDALFLMAACWGGEHPVNQYNGKLDSPCLYGAALDRAGLEALRDDGAPRDLAAPLLAAWDFELDVSSDRVSDRSANQLHGVAVNMPARAMTGVRFHGDKTHWVQAPGQYGAIHFHDDDLYDAGWEADFTLVVPDTLRSGVYAAKLTSGGAEDYLPFFVRPKDRLAASRILFLASTNTYLAYANEHSLADLATREALGITWPFPVQEQLKYAVAEHLLSLYDHHSDGSGVCYSSRLRPIVNSMRPGVNDELLGDGVGYPHALNADLHLTDWMEEQGFQYDVATDEDLHLEGVDLLAQYAVVVTGSHPEYWSLEMLDSLEAYLAQGGRVMYMGGNGFYWVTSFAPGRTDVIEVRRWGGTQAWTAQPGERYHSTTGELGGLWRARGRAPQRSMGVGFVSQGFDRSLPYRREPGSFDPRAAWIFEGVSVDQPIGDFGLVMGGAAGFEVDLVDPLLGSPPHTLVLASATGFSDSYQHVIEELRMSNSQQGGSVSPRVRSEMAFFETPNGGAVFSVGSISYCGSLSHNNYDNDVSRLTGNVLRRFMSDEPI